MAEPANSIAGFENVLDDFSYPENFQDVFADWVVANYLDDPSIGDGRYGYVGETLPPFHPFATFSTYPVGPNNASVQRWAADYARFLSGADLVATFDGADNNDFRVRALLLDPVAATEVVDVPLDGSQAAMVAVPQVGNTHDELVMVYAGAKSTGGTGYQYGMEVGATGVSAVVEATSLSLVPLASGSGRPSFVVGVPEDAAGRALSLDLYDVSGRHVRQLEGGSAVPGTRRVAWDGRDDAGQAITSGVYFVRLSVGEEHVTARATVVR